MTTRKPKKKEPTPPPRRPTRPGTFQPGAHAAAAARARHEHHRNPGPAPQTTPQTGPQGTPLDPVGTVGVDRIAERLGIDPEKFAQAAAVVGLERAAQAWPPSAQIELERLAPAWAAGYLERVTPNRLQAWGDLKEYIRNVWGGGLYAVRVLNGTAPAWIADQVPVAGPTRYQGAEITPQTFAASFAPPPAPPAASIPDAVQETLDRIAEGLENIRQTPAQLADQAGATVADPVAGLAGDLERWARTNERIGAALRGYVQHQAPAAPAAPDDDEEEEEDEEQHPAADMADEWIRRAVESIFPLPGGQTHKAPGHATGAVNGPATQPAAAGPPAGEVESAERIE